MSYDIANQMELLASEVEWELPIHVSGLLNDGAAEIRRLREAVRVLAEVAVAATSDAEENYYTNIRRAMMKVSANPIAAAAVEAARKGGER